MCIRDRFYDVFEKYDPRNLLLQQSRREVLDNELELHRLRQVLERIATRSIVVTRPPHPTPFAFPLMIERIREKLSTEKVGDRVARMLADLEKWAG